MIAGVHGFALGRARFVDDALEEAADRGVGQRAGIGALGVFQDFALAVGLIKRKILRLLELADFQRATGALIEKLDEFAVDFIDAAPPITERVIAQPRGGKGRGAQLLSASECGRPARSRRHRPIWHFRFRRPAPSRHRRVGQAAQHGDMAGQRDAEAYGDGKLRDRARAPQQRGQFVGERILCAGYAGARNQIKKPGRDCGDFRRDARRWRWARREKWYRDDAQPGCADSRRILRA